MTQWIVVREGKGPLSSGSTKMLERLVGESNLPHPPLTYINVEASTVPQARKESAAVRSKLPDDDMDRILTMGPLALMAVRGDQKKPLVADERGRMQYFGDSDVLLMPTMDPALVWANPLWFRDFAYDVIKWASHDEPYPFPPLDYAVAGSFVDLQRDLRPLQSRAVLTLDIETTGLDPLRDEILSIGIGSLDADIVIVPRQLLGDEKVKDLLWDTLWSDPLVRVVLHNAKFDLQFLARWWGALPDGSRARIGDTQLLHHLMDERPVRSRYRAHGLKDLTRVRYDVPNYTFDHDLFQARFRGDEGTEALKQVDWDAFHEYHAMDCLTTAMLWRDLVPEAVDESPALMTAHDMLLMPATLALAESELYGVLVDHDFLVAQKAKLERRLDCRIAAIRDWLADPEFKPGSPAQFVKVIKERFGVTDQDWPGKSTGAKAYDRKTKNPTGIAEIRQLVDRFRKDGRYHDAALLRSVMAYRQDAKNLSTYINGLLEHTGPDGRVHAQFNLGGTETGRLSSSNPNLHAIPKYGSMIAVREAFIAPEGWELLEADYSQLELRTAAALSGDPDLGQVYKDGRDLHLEVASAIFKEEINEVSDEERFMAKAINFGVMYGRSGWAISRGDEMYYAVEKLKMERWTTREAEAYVDRWMEEFPVLVTWSEGQHQKVRKDRYTETPFGRRRRFFLTRPDAKSMGALDRQAVNTPVQSTSSDICLTSYYRVSEAVDRDEARPISIVHDSILLEVRKDATLRVAEQVRAIMEDVQVVDTRGIPFVVDLKHGRTLAEKDMTKIPRAGGG